MRLGVLGDCRTPERLYSPIVRPVLRLSRHSGALSNIGIRSWGFRQVVVLGWNFSAGIGQDIAALNDPHLEVLVIPPDLLDRLKKKSSLDKLAGEVRFSSLQYLQAHVAERKTSGDGEELHVVLDNYVFSLRRDQPRRKEP